MSADQTTFLMGYITTSGIKESQKIAKILLEERLIACANIIEPMDSMYWWENKIETSKESLLIIKTTLEKKENIITLINKTHSYDCPCVLFYEVNEGSAPYLEWLKQQLK